MNASPNKNRLLPGLMAAAALGTLAYGLWPDNENQLRALAAANQQRTEHILRTVCAAPNVEEQLKQAGELTAGDKRDHARTLLWEGPRLLFTSDPTVAAPTPLLTGEQRMEPGWIGWAAVDLPCGRSVQRFQKIIK
jgi:hypothetical protein